MLACLCNRFSFYIIYSYILSCPMLYILLYTHILLPPFIHSLIYILLYTTKREYILAPIFTLFLLYTLYSLIYNGRNYLCPYFTHHIPLLMLILYTLIYYTIFSPAIFTHTFLLYTAISTAPRFHAIHCYTYSLIWKGITTLPPIFTHFISLS